MKLLLKSVLVVSLLSMLLLTGCGDKDGGEDTHYKPSEYKHNIAIDKASRAIDDINKEIIAMGMETSADVVFNTYTDGISALKEQVVVLENTKKLLSEDTDLSNSEVKSWTARYNDTIKALEINIEKIEKQKANFLK